MKYTKIAISEEELAILNNAEFFKAKRKITDQISTLFAELRDALTEEAAKHASNIPATTDKTMGKLSKGENYLDLPYLILDFPKLFNKETVFAFRSMCWWGNFFSFQFHLSGTAWEDRKANIIKNIAKLEGQGFYICIHASPWHFHFDADNYSTIEDYLLKHSTTELEHASFFKIGRKYPLSEWPAVIAKGQETLAFCLNLLEKN